MVRVSLDGGRERFKGVCITEGDTHRDYPPSLSHRTIVSF